MEFLIVGLLAFLVGFVGGRLHSRSSGTIQITETEDRTIFSLELNGDPMEIAEKKYVRFDVEA